MAEIDGLERRMSIRELTTIEKELIDRRKTGFNLFLEERMPILADFMKRLDLPNQAAEKGVYFQERLEEINAPVIREVRSRGLLIGVELKTKVAPYLRALQAEGVLALPAGLNVLRFLPPAVITREQIDTVVEKTAKVLAA